ncbi:MAG: DUF4173 domain-containing protein [Acidimicrobiales bacterium]|nr:DUF4173 domain-containing protein [Acidimicrobiales bacterium]
MTEPHTPLDIPPPTAADRVKEPTSVSRPARSTATPLRSEWVAGALAVGVLLDIAVRQQYMSSVGVSMLLVGSSLAVWFAGVSRGTRTAVLLTASAMFAVLLSVRSDPRLTAFNLIASIMLLGLGALGGRIPNLFEYRLAQLVRDGLETAFYFVETAIETVKEANIRSGSARRTGRIDPALQVLRGVALATPLIVVLTVLLASADVIFSNLVSLDAFNPARWFLHIAFVVGGVYVFAVIMRLGVLPPRFAPVPSDSFRLGATETIVVLSSLVALFGVFTLIQIFAFLGGGSETLATAGITYSDHARQGFFQLLWVAGITLVVLMVFWVITVRSERSTPVLRALNMAALALIIGIVGVAMGRLQLYITSQGLTPLRFYSSVFSVWVGVAFVIVGIRLAGVKAGAAWLMSALVGSGLVVLIILNVLNPDALIVSYNVDRFNHTEPGKIDTISDDGVAALLPELNGFPAEIQKLILLEVCEPPVDSGLFNWNLGRSRAESARLRVCG